MFTTKKRKNYLTFIYSAIIVVLCLLIVAIAWPAAPADPTEPSDPVNASKQTEQTEPTEPKESVKPPETSSEQTNNNDNSQDPDFDEKNNISEDSSTYYLVKSVDGQIKVFFINKSGEPLELETTQIVYELLSTADQKLFDEGCRVESQEELAVLLQDFES